MSLTFNDSIPRKAFSGFRGGSLLAGKLKRISQKGLQVLGDKIGIQGLSDGRGPGKLFPGFGLGP